MFFENYYVQFVSKFRNAKFLPYNNFLTALNSNEIQKILFLQNEKLFFGVLADKSIVFHNPIKDEFFNQILENISEKGIQAKELTNIFSTSRQLLLIILFTAFILVSLHAEQQRLTKFDEEKLKILQKNTHDNNEKREKESNEELLSLFNNLEKKSGNKFFSQNNRLYDKHQRLDNFVFANDDIKKTVENLIEFYKNEFGEKIENVDETKKINQKLFLELLQKSFSVTGKENSSIIFYGPPGTGKTLLGHVIANELDAEFSYKNSTDFISKYINQGPTMVNNFFEDIFKKLDALKDGQKFVCFIDEIDIAFSTRKNPENPSASEANQLTTSFLTKIEECQKKYSDKLILVFATNNIANIDPAILSRISKKIEIPGLLDDQKIQLFKKKFDKLKDFIANFDETLDQLYKKNKNWFNLVSGREIDVFCGITSNFLIEKINTQLNQIIETGGSDEEEKNFVQKYKEIGNEISELEKFLLKIKQNEKSENEISKFLLPTEKDQKTKYEILQNQKTDTQSEIDAKKSDLTKIFMEFSKNQKIQITQEEISEILRVQIDQHTKLLENQKKNSTLELNNVFEAFLMQNNAKS